MQTAAIKEKSGKNLAETDLYRPIASYLEKNGYTVRGEVNHCDVAAYKGDDLIVVELKRNLSVMLLAQAVERQKITDSVYVAIPRPANKRRWMATFKPIQALLRRLELGLILVSTDRRKPQIDIILHPSPYQKHRRKSARRAVIQEIGNRSADLNEGGCCRRKLVTAYRENAVFVACCLLELGPLTPKQLRTIGTGDKTFSILYRNVYSWFDRIGKGIYEINSRGRSEVGEFASLVDHYRQVIAEHIMADEDHEVMPKHD